MPRTTPPPAANTIIIRPLPLLEKKNLDPHDRELHKLKRRTCEDAKER